MFFLQAENTHAAIDEAVEATKEAIDDLLKSVQEAPEAIISGLVDSIAAATEVRNPVDLLPCLAKFYKFSLKTLFSKHELLDDVDKVVCSQLQQFKLLDLSISNFYK